MARKRKVIQLSRKSSAEIKERDLYVCFNNCGETRWANPSSTRNSTEDGFSFGVQPSDIDALMIRLEECLEKNDADELLKLLNADFIYSFTHADHDVAWDKGADYFDTRPLIEVLIFEEALRFQAFLEKLLQKKSEALFKSVLTSFEKNDVPRNICDWRQTTKDNVVKSLQALGSYGETLAKKGESDASRKAQCAKEIAQLAESKAVTEQVVLDQPSEQEKIANLSFKLKLISELHKYDGVFAKHLGWKYHIANFCSVLFTDGLLNLFNRAVFGRWTFFNNTTTQEKVAKVDEAFGFTAKQAVQFKRK